MERLIKFSFMWQHQKTGEWLNKIYTLDRIIAGDPYDDMSDSPLLRNYHHKHTREYSGLEGCYEGDIVKITGEGYYSNDAFTVDEEEWEFIGKVEMNSFMWLVVQEDGTWFSFADMVEGDFGFETIGNIYENPELIK